MLSPEGRCAVKLGHCVFNFDDSVNFTKTEESKKRQKWTAELTMKWKCAHVGL